MLNGATLKVHMPHVCLYENKRFVSFTDGRHRFAWCRDHEVKFLPVSVATKKEEKKFKRLFGTESRCSRMPAT